MVQSGEERNILEFDTKEIYKMVATACYKYNPNYLGEFEDMVQDVTLYVVERLHKFDKNKGKLSTFVYHNARYGVINYNIKMNAKKRKKFFLLYSLDEVIGQDPEDELSNFVVSEDGYIDDMLFREIYDNTTGLEREFMEQIIKGGSDWSVYKRLNLGKHDYIKRKKAFYSKIKRQYFATS